MFFQLPSHLWLSTGSVRWHFCRLRMLIDNECPWNEIYDGLSLSRETYGAAQVVPLWKRVLSAVQVAGNTGIETHNSYSKPIKQVKSESQKLNCFKKCVSKCYHPFFFILKNPEICLSQVWGRCVFFLSPAAQVKCHTSNACTPRGLEARNHPRFWASEHLPVSVHLWAAILSRVFSSLTSWGKIHAGTGSSNLVTRGGSEEDKTMDEWGNVRAKFFEITTPKPFIQRLIIQPSNRQLAPVSG